MMCKRIECDAVVLAVGATVTGRLTSTSPAGTIVVKCDEELR
jgi:hypothetical protein